MYDWLETHIFNNGHTLKRFVAIGHKSTTAPIDTCVQAPYPSSLKPHHPESPASSLL
jgi:hypothetical protein